VAREPPIPVAKHSPTTVSLQASDFQNAVILGQIDRKFILLAIPTLKGILLAAIDQHAADERYRLELILESLRESTLDVSIQFELQEKYRAILSQRTRRLLEWGVKLDILGGNVEITRIPAILIDVEPARWKQILQAYTNEDTLTCPSGLAHMFNSKACRSVRSPKI
jgi:DNA mismatch repair ATPase MutL